MKETNNLVWSDTERTINVETIDFCTKAWSGAMEDITSIKAKNIR